MNARSIRFYRADDASSAAETPHDWLTPWAPSALPLVLHGERSRSLSPTHDRTEWSATPDPRSYRRRARRRRFSALSWAHGGGGGRQRTRLGRGCFRCRSRGSSAARSAKKPERVPKSNAQLLLNLGLGGDATASQSAAACAVSYW